MLTTLGIIVGGLNMLVAVALAAHGNFGPGFWINGVVGVLNLTIAFHRMESGQ